MAASWSPKPQSQLARASAGIASMSSFTRGRLPCDAPTTSRTRSRAWKGKEPRDSVAAPELELEKSRTRELEMGELENSKIRELENENAGASERNERRVSSDMDGTLPEDV